MVTKSYTLEIGGVERVYSKINYEDKLEKTTPSKFSATIKLYDDLDYFDLVEIKCNGTTEWKGFLEDYDIDWSSNGANINVGGRDTSIILWKKWVEGFSDMHPDTQGFFGYVNAVELIQFLLRSPKSDYGTDFPNNKSGWGIDAGTITNCSAYRTSVGSPTWVKLRRQGYGWRNTGNAFNSGILAVNAVISNNWTTHGSSPYLKTEDDVNYISSGTSGQISIFSFPNMSTLSALATGINQVSLTISWRPDQTFWTWIQAETDVYIYDGSTWYYLGLFGGRESPWSSNPWRRYTWDVSHILDTIAKVDAAQVKFVCQSNDLSTNITYTCLNVGYQTSGTQDKKDYFDVSFLEDTIMGIYFESRMDNDSYPRNYAIYKVTDNEQDYTDYTETDPNSHITKTASHIDFDAYMNETAYVDKDFTAGYFGEHQHHFVKCKVVTDPVPEPASGGDAEGNILCFWALANEESNIYSLVNDGTKKFLALTVWKDPDDVILSGAPCFCLYEGTSSGVYSTITPELTEGKTYSFDIERNVDSIKVIVYEDDVYWNTLTLTMQEPANTFRYLYACSTSNTSTADHCDVDIDSLSLETETELISETSNTFKDIIHSWEPQTMTNLRIRITAESSGNSWAISQLYVYKADDIDYRVMYESGTAPSFSLDQYIQEVSFDDSYAVPVGPLNIAKGRLLDAINSIVTLCHESYVSFETWLALNSNNTFHFANQKGTDKSGTISFVKGTHLGGVTKSCTIADTVQRVQVIGKGEGKKQDDVSSDWTEDTTEMSNINTFFEDVVTEKTIANKDVANLLANIHLTTNAPAKESIEIKINNDESYAVGAYGIGDYVTVTDSITSTSGSKRIYNIRKTIDGNGGVPTLNVNAPREITEEAYKSLIDKIKQLGLAGVIAADWGGQALNQTKVDSETALSTLFEKTAKNDIVEAKKTVQDPVWYTKEDPYGTPTDPASYTAPVGHVGGTAKAERYNYSNSMMWHRTDDWMKMVGPASDSSAHDVLVEIRNTDDEGNDISIPLSKNPKLTVELKPVKNTSGTPVDWVNDDYFIIGLYDSDTGIGYTVKIVKESGVLNAYAVYNNTGASSDITTVLLRSLEISDVGSGEDKRYKIEIITEAENNLVIFNIYDLSSTVEEKYPISIIASNIILTNTVRPLFMYLNANNGGSASNLCQIYIYNFKTEIEEVST